MIIEILIGLLFAVALLAVTALISFVIGHCLALAFELLINLWILIWRM